MFAYINNKHKLSESNPVVALTAEDYQRFFNHAPPITRMLRRQINNVEYIALTGSELVKEGVLTAISFVVPVVKLNRGYYETELKIISLGKIKAIKPNVGGNYVAYFDGASIVNLRSVQQFVRWIGL